VTDRHDNHTAVATDAGTGQKRRPSTLPRIAHAGPDPTPVAIDIESATKAASAFLAALGVAIGQPVLADTPRRMARAYAQLLTPPSFTPTVFPNDPHYGGLVVVRDIRFASVCEHHMLPFVGTVDLGYLPGESLAGLSKLAWAVKKVSHRIQVQERMTTQLADWLEQELAPRAVAVRARAEHMCMQLRGAQTPHASTLTQVYRGDLMNDPLLRAEWAQLVQ
jgi:GTP cyclohydrolase I